MFLQVQLQSLAPVEIREAETTDRGLVLTLRNVLFATGTFEQAATKFAEENGNKRSIRCDVSNLASSEWMDDHGHGSAPNGVQAFQT